MTRQVAAIVVAAGRGERAGSKSDGPKQYRRIGGRSVIARTLESLHGIDRIVVVLHPDDRDRFSVACRSFEARVEIVEGGATRQLSVLAGLRTLAARAPDVVLIHDAARPFADDSLIDRVVSAVTKDSGALPVLAVSDTLKQGLDGLVAKTVDRSALFSAQTPQGFPFAPILAAHEAAARSGRDDFTDDASIAEWAGLPVRLVEGSPDNVKLTYARDIALADERLSRSNGSVDIRTGNGYDVHRLIEGDHVVLCGVRIDHEQTLDGHSDADVGLHALTDALLATCGAGDIGDHFPPSDPQWKGAASHRFVRHAAQIVATKGGTVLNADVSLICEAPRIGPHRLAMREAIAEMLGIELERVSVKATTNETIGFVGRREGIAAIATASVRYGART